MLYYTCLSGIAIIIRKVVGEVKVLKEETPSFLKMSGQKFEKKLIFLHSFTYFFQNWGA